MDESKMTRDDIIRMAREADREWDCDRDMFEWLEWFAALVAAAEREACARVCDLVAKEIDDTNGNATYCAAAIRRRSEIDSIVQNERSARGQE